MGYAFGWWVLQNKMRTSAKRDLHFFKRWPFRNRTANSAALRSASHRQVMQYQDKICFFKTTYGEKKEKKRGENKNFNNKSAKEGKGKEENLWLRKKRTKICCLPARIQELPYSNQIAPRHWASARSDT